MLCILRVWWLTHSFTVHNHPLLWICAEGQIRFNQYYEDGHQSPTEICCDQNPCGRGIHCYGDVHLMDELVVMAIISCSYKYTDIIILYHYEAINFKFLVLLY